MGPLVSQLHCALVRVCPPVWEHSEDGACLPFDSASICRFTGLLASCLVLDIAWSGCSQAWSWSRNVWSQLLFVAAVGGPPCTREAAQKHCVLIGAMTQPCCLDLVWSYQPHWCKVPGGRKMHFVYAALSHPHLLACLVCRMVMCCV